MSHPAGSAALPVLVLLVRHGATEWSVAGRHTGRTDLPLTGDGVAQAAAARPVVERLLAMENPGTECLDETPLVFTSPLRRARHTAEIVMAGAEAVVVDQLAEIDYGEYEGLTSAEILARDPDWDLFTTGCPGGERPHQVAARCDAFVAKLERVAAGRKVVVVSHGHLGRVLTVRLLGLPVSAASALWNETASVGVVNLHRGRFTLVGWNVTAG